MCISVLLLYFKVNVVTLTMLSFCLFKCSNSGYRLHENQYTTEAEVITNTHTPYTLTHTLCMLCLSNWYLAIKRGTWGKFLILWLSWYCTSKHAFKTFGGLLISAWNSVWENKYSRPSSARIQFPNPKVMSSRKYLVSGHLPYNSLHNEVLTVLIFDMYECAGSALSTRIAS